MKDGKAKVAAVREVETESKGSEPGQPEQPKAPKTEDDIIWLAVSSLRNRAKKLSPEGRQKLFGMVRGFVG